MSKPFYPVGRYVCKITSQALGEASTGNPQFILRFQVLGQVDPLDPTTYIPADQQYERSYYRVITEKSIDYFVEDLKILGFSVGSFKELDPSSANFQDMRGENVEMWCGHEDAQSGGQREKWSVAQKAGGGFKVEPLDAKKVRDLDNLYGKQLRTLKTDKPAPVMAGAARAESEAAAVTDDDVPF